MKQITWHRGTNFTVDHVDNLLPPDGWVLVKIDTVGVCGTDVHITQGLFPATPPSVLGHEASGIIEDVGKGVKKNRIGDRVALNITSSCGKCEYCLNWTISRCKYSQNSTPFFAEYSIVPQMSAVKIPNELNLEIACMTEPASCCLSGVNMLSTNEASTAVVIGGGIMGQFCVGFLKQSGVPNIILSEPVKSRREIAVDMGANILHNPNDSKIEDFVIENTLGNGADIAIEAVGNPDLVAKCIEIVKPKGQVLMIGVSPDRSHLPVNLYEMHYREIVLKGAFGRGEVFSETPNLLTQLNLDRMISGRYELNEVKKAIADSAEGKGIKLVVKP